jgi:hypothetical protein
MTRSLNRPCHADDPVVQTYVKDCSNPPTLHMFLVPKMPEMSTLLDREQMPLVCHCLYGRKGASHFFDDAYTLLGRDLLEAYAGCKDGAEVIAVQEAWLTAEPDRCLPEEDQSEGEASWSGSEDDLPRLERNINHRGRDEESSPGEEEDEEMEEEETEGGGSEEESGEEGKVAESSGRDARSVESNGVEQEPEAEAEAEASRSLGFRNGLGRAGAGGGGKLGRKQDVGDGVLMPGAGTSGRVDGEWLTKVGGESTLTSAEEEAEEGKGGPLDAAQKPSLESRLTSLVVT